MYHTINRILSGDRSDKREIFAYSSYSYVLRIKDRLQLSIVPDVIKEKTTVKVPMK